MSTRAERFAGLSVALVTPFRDGGIDAARFAEQIDFQAAAGTTCICPVGTTGESPTLTHDEHERVIAESVQRAAGRLLVMPGTGSNSTAEAVRLTKFAARAGADAALVVGPYYNRPTQQGIYEHFRALAEAVDIPICIYNIPSRTGRNIDPETIIRLAELPGIAMVKEATGLAGARCDRSDAPLRR
jgi:4-hydroxy-tetrahydrodipicolinate synthase